MPTPHRLIFYTKPDCQLCDRLLSMMQPIIDDCQQASRVSVQIDFVDVTTNPVLEERYRVRIPVVTRADGTILFEGRPDLPTVEAALQSSLVI